MKIPRDLYGRELAAALCARWADRQVNQVGSHIILQTETPQHHRLSVPDHKPLRLGTLNAILRQVAAASCNRYGLGKSAAGLVWQSPGEAGGVLQQMAKIGVLGGVESFAAEIVRCCDASEFTADRAGWQGRHPSTARWSGGDTGTGVMQRRR